MCYAFGNYKRAPRFFTRTSFFWSADIKLDRNIILPIELRSDFILKIDFHPKGIINVKLV
jgi:hypothetical protein